MPKYYVIAGGIEVLSVKYALAGASFAVDQFDTVSSELLQHCLNQEFKFRCCDQARTVDQLVLFSDKKDAERFSGALSDTATITECKKYYPIFEVEINVQLVCLQENNLYEKLPSHLRLQGFNAGDQSFNCCVVDENISKTFKQNLRIIDIDLPYYQRKENIYFPKALIEEAQRPFFDKNFFLWLGFTFWTVIIPIIYTIYRLLKSSDANAALIDQKKGKLVDENLQYKMHIKDKTAHFNWTEKPLQTTPIVPQQPEPTINPIYQFFFPEQAEEERLKSMFPNLIFRKTAGGSSYTKLKDSYSKEEYWNPKKYTLHGSESPERADYGIKNEVTQESMLEIPFYMIALEHTNAWAMPVSAENARLIRQMIKVNYCGYFADKNGTPTKAGKMVTAELDKIETALKTSPGLNKQ